MKRILSILLCLSLTAGLLSGCNIGEGGGYTPTGDGLTWDDGTPGGNANGEEESEQVLTLAYYPDRSMNPYTATDFTNRALFSLIYQGLFSVDREYQVCPILCSQYTVSEDMNTYTFYLEEATFSDKTPVTAQDVVASLLAAKSGAYYSGRLTYVTAVTAGGDGGITVSLSTPCENLPVLLDIPIVKASETGAARPLGTGPYAFESTVSGGLHLRRRNDWWCSAELLVTASSIALTRAENPAQIRDEFQFSDLSFVCADPGSDYYADYRCDYELWDCENGIFLYLACNMESPVFSDPNVRTALTRAIDREALVQDFYRGFARSAALPASPLSPYYNTTLASRYSYDEAIFAQAVNDAGMVGQTVILLVNSDDSLRLRVARQVGAMLANCGLVIQMKEVSGSSYLSALQNKEYDLYLGETKLSANMDLSAFFAASGSLRYGGINDVTMYAMCVESLANQGNYYTLHQTVMEDGRLCPILFRSYAIYAVRGALTGIAPSRDNVFCYSLGRTLADALITE